MIFSLVLSERWMSDDSTSERRERTKKECVYGRKRSQTCFVPIKLPTIYKNIFLYYNLLKIIGFGCLNRVYSSSMSLKPKSVLNGQSREFVIRLRDYFRRESENGGPLLPVSQVVDRVAEALGISRKTISRITKEKYGVDGTEENALKTPGTKRLKKKPITGTESLDINAILKHITDYQNCNEQFTATKLRLSLIDAGLFSGGKTSFYRLLKRLGFCFEKSGKMKVLSMKRFVIKSDGPAKSKSKKCKKAIAPLPDFNPAVAPAPLENKALCPSMGHLLPHHNMVLKQTDPALVANDNMRKMMLDCGGYNQHLIYPNVNRHHNDPL